MRVPLSVRALVLVLALWPVALSAAQSPPERIRSLKVLVLSTMLAELRSFGEWGFAALVEADDRRLLFDTGSHPDTVLRNARELGVDLTGIEEVILSHNHYDHTAGLLTLRRELAKTNPKALSRAHVGRGIFWERPGTKPEESIITIGKAYEELGGRFVEHGGPIEIHPGIWLTGPVPRVHPERNWSPPGPSTPGGRVRSPEGLVEDVIPEDQSLVIDTDEGLVVISGCGHAGIINTLEYSRKVVRDSEIHAALGGFHLFRAGDDVLSWTGGKLRELGLEHLVGAHCTGIEAVFRLRETAGLDRRHCVVGAVGASFTLRSGIEPLDLAR
jgi:7,8-dihydropterin-6-yl-methyl-4-(beta-D-ribofuranosyl)aminobenzene 5'-phosphate synthase